MTQATAGRDTAQVQALLTRLRAGQSWLIDTGRKLMKMDDLGFGSALESQYLEGVQVWDDLERELRDLHEYQSCIHASSGKCPARVVVVCRACSSTNTEGPRTQGG